MTATFTDRVLASHVSGDHLRRATMNEIDHTPGTLWERVKDSADRARRETAFEELRIIEEELGEV